MSLTLNSNEINFEIFKYLDLNELKQLYDSNKILQYDIEKYSKHFFKKTWMQILKEKKCIHCFKLSDDKICDNCISDTCWKCFNKVGCDNLHIDYIDNLDILDIKTVNKHSDPILCCINECKFNCNICKKKLNKSLIYSDNINYKTYCINCYKN